MQRNTVEQRRVLLAARKAIRERCDLYIGQIKAWRVRLDPGLAAESFDHADKAFLVAARLQVFNWGLEAADGMNITGQDISALAAFLTERFMTAASNVASQSMSPTENIMRLYRVQAWGELVELVGGMMVDADPKPHSGKTIDIEAGDPAAIEHKKDP
jgi:hypothetical protein